MDCNAVCSFEKTAMCEFMVCLATLYSLTKLNWITQFDLNMSYLLARNGNNTYM